MKRALVNIFNPRMIVAAMAAMMLLALAGCQGGIDDAFPKAQAPVPEKLVKRMKAKDMDPASPILIRIFKEEDKLEVWKQKRNGRFDLLEEYEICKWSGQLGPKFKEGDRQAPEGFYTITRGQMNPKSSYYLSFNIGYPNRYDRSHGRTGTHLMVHGACSSAGCYSMTDERIAEIYALARESFDGGQKSFQVQAYPFRLTAENLAKHADSQHLEFWKMLKEGFDQFELTKMEPKVDVCEKRYVFNWLEEEGRSFSSSDACPPATMNPNLLSAYASYRQKEDQTFRKVMSREIARARLAGKDFANLGPSSLTIVAKGSEQLPPPTPAPEPEPQPEPETAALTEAAPPQVGTSQAAGETAGAPVVVSDQGGGPSSEVAASGEPATVRKLPPTIDVIPTPAER